MPISVTVKHRDESTTRVEVWASTEVAFEDEFQISWSEAFSKQYVHQKHLYFAAYHAAAEAGKTGLPFKEWMKTIAQVELEGSEPDPLDLSGPAGSSEPSQ